MSKRLFTAVSTTPNDTYDESPPQKKFKVMEQAQRIIANEPEEKIVFELPYNLDNETVTKKMKKHLVKVTKQRC